MNISSLNTPAVISPSISSSLQPGNAQTATQGGKNARVEQAGSEGSLQDKRQVALQIVNKTLTAAYEKISSRGQAANAEYQHFEPLSAEKVANNILGFIERRLQMDVADGATPEELQSRLDAGLSGFKKGFAEASEKLEALSLLSPEVKSDIGKTYDLVLEGVDELRKKFIESASPKPDSSNAANNKAGLTSNSETGRTDKLEVPDFLPASSSSHIGYGNYEYGRALEFSFELTTKEGDKVTIKATSSEGLAVESARITRGGASASAANGSYSSSESFSLSIDGDLNEEEMGAINDLLGRVNDLAGQFFAGNLDSAFDQAMAIGYDEKQIGSFALNLSQVEIRQITQAYQRMEPPTNGASAPSQISAQLLPMGEFIRDLLDSLDRASIFNRPEELLGSIAETITGTGDIEVQQGHRFREFMDRIFALDLQ